ncbi:hypothetical protein D9M70_646000 [compost metagenome]
MTRPTPIGPATCTGSKPSVIRCHAAVSSTVISTMVATAHGNGSTRNTANATGTAHHANDGATAVSAPQSTTIPLTQTVGHQARPASSPRVA